MLPDWMYWASLSAIPATWYGINRCRACISKRQDNRQVKWLEYARRSNFYVEPPPPPPADVWCSKCDTLYPETMMAWDKEGDDYLCGYCLDIPKMLAVLRIWHKWHLGQKDIGIIVPIYNEGGEIIGHRNDSIWAHGAKPWPVWGGEQVQAWPGIGGPEAARRNFDENGFEADANGIPLDPNIRQYRAAGIDVTDTTNAAYERGIAERARNRKRRKENLMWRNYA